METVVGSIKHVKTNISAYTKSKKIILILGLVVLLLFAWFVKTEYLDQPTLVTINGEGRVAALPEMVKFTVRVINNSDSPSIAAIDNNRIMRDLLSIIKNTGVKESDIIVSYVRVIPPTASLGLTNYQAVNSVDVTLRDVSKFDNLVNTLYSGGAASVSNILFTSEDSRELEKMAVAEAIKDAKNRAREMSRASGKRLGRMVSIQTTELGEAGALSGEPASAGFAGQISASPSQIEIVRRVIIIFELR